MLAFDPKLERYTLAKLPGCVWETNQYNEVIEVYTNEAILRVRFELCLVQ